MKKKSRIVVIKEFFEMDTKQCMKEMKPLTDEEKTELAVGAAQNLGYTQDQVGFSLQ